MCILIARTKGEGASVNYSSFQLPYSMEDPRGSIFGSSSLLFQAPCPHLRVAHALWKSARILRKWRDFATFENHRQMKTWLVNRIQNECLENFQCKWHSSNQPFLNYKQYKLFFIINKEELEIKVFVIRIKIKKKSLNINGFWRINLMEKSFTCLIFPIRLDYPSLVFNCRFSRKEWGFVHCCFEINNLVNTELLLQLGLPTIL